MLIVLSFLTTGCIRLHTNIKMNNDGSGTWQYVIAISKELVEMQKMQAPGEDPFVDIKQEAISEGFLVEDYEKDDYVGVTLNKDFTDIEEVNTRNFMMDMSDEVNEINEDEFNSFFKPEINVDRGFFFTIYEINAEMDLSSEEALSEEEQMSQLMSNQMFDLQFSVDSPVEVENHNATLVNNNGKLLTWGMKMGENNTINFKIKVLNMRNVLILFLIGLVLILSVFFVIYKSRAKYVHS
ncbi:MAG: LppM family (lipo)protein, partial [Bacillota bacterium]